MDRTQETIQVENIMHQVISISRHKIHNPYYAQSKIKKWTRYNEHELIEQICIM